VRYTTVKRAPWAWCANSSRACWCSGGRVVALAVAGLPQHVGFAFEKVLAHIQIGGLGSAPQHQSPRRHEDPGAICPHTDKHAPMPPSNLLQAAVEDEMAKMPPCTTNANTGHQVGAAWLCEAASASTTAMASVGGGDERFGGELGVGCFITKVKSIISGAAGGAWWRMAVRSGAWRCVAGPPLVPCPLPPRPALSRPCRQRAHSRERDGAERVKELEMYPA
jgi:hypothetical protein